MGDKQGIVMQMMRLPHSLAKGASSPRGCCMKSGAQAHLRRDGSASACWLAGTHLQSCDGRGDGRGGDHGARVGLGAARTAPLRAGKEVRQLESPGGCASAFQRESGVLQSGPASHTMH